MKTVLRATALLFLGVTMAHAAPLALTSPDVSSIVPVQRGYRPPPPAPHPVEPSRPYEPTAPVESPHPFQTDPSAGHFNSPLIRPHDFNVMQPVPDLAVRGGAVKTQHELERENSEKSRDCPSLTDTTKPDNCNASSALPR